eukprot:NODE_5835_length_904_cov_138.982074_g5609_i0.p1 GENE.NODE_5835_length_904_cov_138.982074_g5609_i0~~NODE_5835_length_904_cov_138.982074_g5609_i0.p1  ORF type:complete len:102 (-),score=19.46 NODE_5835_length_904_cov_138.982074_g5609_i0:193-498(-)
MSLPLNILLLYLIPRIDGYSHQDAATGLKSELLNVALSSAVLWIPVSWFNYTLIEDTHNQLIICTTVEAVYAMLLSYFSHKNEEKLLEEQGSPSMGVPTLD